MIVLTIILIFYVKIRRQPLSFFPEKFHKKYIIVTIIAAAIYIAAPTNYINGITYVLTILFSSIVTPVFEEVLFRGYIWGRFEATMTKELYIYIWNIALFTIWHLFYIIPEYYSGYDVGELGTTTAAKDCGRSWLWNSAWVY